ncbi:hypothetical protein GCM10022420_000430 [Streptomyces iranensis]
MRSTNYGGTTSAASAPAARVAREAAKVPPVRIPLGPRASWASGPTASPVQGAQPRLLLLIQPRLLVPFGGPDLAGRAFDENAIGTLAEEMPPVLGKDLLVDLAGWVERRDGGDDRAARCGIAVVHGGEPFPGGDTRSGSWGRRGPDRHSPP